MRRPLSGLPVRDRRVPLPADSPRGGIMTQASVLKVTANGTTTSPVLRGAWIMDRIIGEPPPPPPPNVPAVERRVVPRIARRASLLPFAPARDHLLPLVAKDGERQQFAQRCENRRFDQDDETAVRAQMGKGS